VEGAAEKVTDPASVADMASRWAAQGWPARVDESGTAMTAAYRAPPGGAAAVGRLPVHAIARDGGRRRRAGRRDALVVLERDG
jgi:hypothetical protein